MRTTSARMRIVESRGYAAAQVLIEQRHAGLTDPRLGMWWRWRRSERIAAQRWDFTGRRCKRRNGNTPSRFPDLGSSLRLPIIAAQPRSIAPQCTTTMSAPS
jgi:hypothetical protein